MEKTVIFIRGMDCMAEEQVVRMKLAKNETVKKLDFDLGNRRLTVWHTGDVNNLLAAVKSLNFGGELIASEVDSSNVMLEDDATDRKLLSTVLTINFTVFAVELVAGLLAHSMGLIADSLDELADAFIYALSIFAIMGTAGMKNRIARSSGILQLSLALWGFVEIIRRFIHNGPMPNVVVMVAFSCVALAGNVASLYFLRKSKTQEVHIKATQIFTSNDVIVNIGVIFAAILVAALGNRIPDLVVGAIVFVIVLRGAVKIFGLTRSQE